ncbi:hypothetical protein BJ684DRAFT_19315 [Piptocephalis cylindrospora]|uniref:Uncharacterized protein n=1 Tax=Piptocephalis cylindrospora TaxID=1907219 RepID=A0A4P9Y662_9FUNG|nr:hypothetical protein BJ684DRAFT_19315 [Piptocephalis cylindrospora]|eukprot:RKP14262.1 hypothetical protein BJ684DRAFT_19315 [Piptocephalis cylindrospora]
MSEDLPRVQVDSKADIHYLRRELMQALETSLWSSPQAKSLSNSAKREQVRQLVEKWLSDTFSLAGSSIDINGRPYQQAFLEEEVEPFDGELKVQVTELQAKVDALLLQVCALRKSVPRKVSHLTEKTLAKETDRVMKQISSRPPRAATPTADPSPRPVDPSLLHEYQETLQAVNRLKKTIPGAQGHLARALDVAHDQLQQMGLPVNPTVNLFTPSPNDANVEEQDTNESGKTLRESGEKRAYEEMNGQERRRVHQGIIRRLAQDRKRQAISPIQP